jgi:hypothetical protein
VRREFLPLLGMLDTELSPARAAERKADYEALEVSLLVFYAADLAVESRWTSSQKARRKELAAKVRDHDATLSSAAKRAYRNNKEVMRILADIFRGSGNRDDADDTVRLVGVFRDNWASVDGKTLVTKEYLAQAEADATELLKILDDADDPPKGSPRDLRRRAYSVWQRVYTELFHLGRYLSRHDPEAAQKFPGISPERGEAVEEEEQNGEIQQPPPAQTGSNEGT